MIPLSPPCGGRCHGVTEGGSAASDQIGTAIGSSPLPAASPPRGGGRRGLNQRSLPEGSSGLTQVSPLRGSRRTLHSHEVSPELPMHGGHPDWCVCLFTPRARSKTVMVRDHEQTDRMVLPDIRSSPTIRIRYETPSSNWWERTGVPRGCAGAGLVRWWYGACRRH